MILFSRRILGWKLAETMKCNLVIAALRRAVDTKLVARQPIFHSDRGSRYSSGPTRRLLKRQGQQQSMSAVGYCYNNAFAESLFASIQSELLPENSVFESKSETATSIFNYLECFYNRRRLHSALGYQSPQNILARYFQN